MPLNHNLSVHICHRQLSLCASQVQEKTSSCREPYCGL